MIGLLLLLAVDLPLGNFARPGVPVLMKSDEPVVVDLAGWTWRVAGMAEVAPPQLPCSFGGQQLIAVPEGRELVAVVGSPEEGMVSIRLVPGMGWQPLDLFDRIVARDPEDWERSILEAWRRAGKAPRIGNVLPEIYDLTSSRGVGSRSMSLARNLALGMGAALIALLLLRRGARRTVILVLAVGSVGGGLGAWLTRAEAEPFSRAEVVVHYSGRTRLFTFFRAEWDGAEMETPPGVPFFYRGAGDPWWEQPDGTLRADRGVVRGFMRDIDRAVAQQQGESGDERRLRKVFRRLVPDGAKTRWWWGVDGFQGGTHAGRPIVEIEVDAVR